MILMEHQIHPVQAMYFHGDYLPFADVRDRYSVAPGMDHFEELVQAETPENWQELINVAKRNSTAVAAAFSRIGLYNTNKDIYLGEITLYHGTFSIRIGGL